MPSAAATFTKQLHQSISDKLDQYYGGGQILYVCNRGVPDAAPAGDGSSPRYPLSSVFAAGGALAKLNGEVKRGSVILAMPGHTENVAVASAASLAAAASNFAICGLGRGSDRPTFTWTTATSSWLFNTTNMGIANCRLFLAGPSAAGALTVAAPITVSADGCFINDCEIHWGWDADSIVGIGITTTAGATRFRFNRNDCYAETAAVPTTTFLRLTGTDLLEIDGTRIIGPGSTTAIGPVQQLTTAMLKANIKNSIFQNILAASTIAFTALAGSTGTMDKCSLGVLAAGNGITTGSGIQVTGTYVAVAGAAGTLATG